MASSRALMASMAGLRQRLQDSADRREGYRPLPRDEPRTPPQGTSGVPAKPRPDDPPPETGPIAPVQRVVERLGPWLEGWAHSRLLDVGAVRLQYRERSDGDVDVRQLRRVNETAPLEWEGARQCPIALWRAEGWAVPREWGEEQEARAQSHYNNWGVSEADEAAVEDLVRRKSKSRTGSSRTIVRAPEPQPYVECGVSKVPERPWICDDAQAPSESADAEEHGEVDQLAVPDERRPAATGPIRKLFGYLIRELLRRWVEKLGR